MIAPDIDDEAVRAVVMASEHIDPLGLREVEQPDSARTLDTILAALGGVDATRALMVAKAIPLVHTAAQRSGAWEENLPLDVVTAELLAHIGIDPLVASWIAIHGGGFDILDDETRDVVARVDGGRPENAMGDTRCDLGSGAEWRAFGELRMPEILPETAMLALQGRPLRDAVSHPVLDRHLLYIVHAGRDDWNGSTTIITTDHQPRPATLDELTARGPNGCR